MNGYAAHVILYVEFKKATQDHYPVWENIVVVGAEDEAQAFDAAERYGLAEEGDDGGSFRWGGKSARWVFAGVRKVTECDGMIVPPPEPVEVTCNQFVLASLADVKRLASGEPVTLILDDRYRPEAASGKSMGDLSRGQKRRA